MSKCSEIRKFLNASENGDLFRVREFIENGVKVSSTNEQGNTALHLAALRGHVEIAKVLIQNGAKVNAENECQKVPLDLAARGLDITKALFLNGVDAKDVYVAASEAYVGFAKVLIQNGAYVNAVNSRGQPPLHRATLQGYVEIAHLLMQNGSNVNIKDRDNVTALSVAGKEGHFEILLDLLCFGAQINSRAINDDKTGLLRQISDRLSLLRTGNRIKSSLMTNEERDFMWNLAFSLTIQYPAAAFKAFYALRSFITFHGMFMATGYIHSSCSIFWRRRRWRRR